MRYVNMYIRLICPLVLVYSFFFLELRFSIFNNKLLNYDFLGSGLIGVSFPNWFFGICEVNGKLVDMAIFNWWLLFYYLDHVFIQRSKTHDTNLIFLVRVYFAFSFFFCHLTFFIFHDSSFTKSDFSQ